MSVLVGDRGKEKKVSEERNGVKPRRVELHEERRVYKRDADSFRPRSTACDDMSKHGRFCYDAARNKNNETLVTTATNLNRALMVRGTS